MHDDVGVAHLFERRAERLDELVRQVPHEADGVGQRVDAPIGGLAAAHRGVEGREQRVLDEHSRAGQAVQQTGLAGVGVPGDRDGGDRVALAFGTLRLARGSEVAQLAPQLRHLGADAAAVELDLGLTGAARAHARTARTDLATGLPAHRVAPAAQAGQQVFELGELDLGLALAALGVLTEDVEDDGGAVDHFDLDDVFERAPLTGREFSVGDDGVGADGRDEVAELCRLAAPDVGRRVGVRAALQHAVEHDGARGLGERGELAQRVLGVVLRALRVHADEHHVLEAQLAVFDLGDVFELGREPGHTAQRGTLFAIPLIAVGVAVRDRRGILQRLRGAEDMRARPRLGAREHPVDGVDRQVVRVDVVACTFVGAVGVARAGGAGGVCHSIHFVVSLAV